MTDIEPTDMMELLLNDPNSREEMLSLIGSIKESHRLQGEFTHEATLKVSFELVVRRLNKAKELLVVDSTNYSALSQELERALVHCQNAISYLNETPE
jgi:hypothetical protein